MKEESYFQKALSNFTFEVASAGSIRHLAEQGYTVAQIVAKLDFPTPYERVQNTVWESLVDKGRILLEEPGSAGKREKASYIVDSDQYGRKSFRRIVSEVSKQEQSIWTSQAYDNVADGDLRDFMKRKCRENGEESCYMSCDFGLLKMKDAKQYERILGLLDTNQREYICGLPWERRRVYHSLDLRMREIVLRLYQGKMYQGVFYFGQKKEKIKICF